MSGDYLERLRAVVIGLEESVARYGAGAIAHVATLDLRSARPDALHLADLRAALDELEWSRAIIAEGNQRDRALALLLLRNGGQVEFTEAERAAAPQHGQLISYPNPATGGLVLAYSEDGETVGLEAARVDMRILREDLAAALARAENAETERDEARAELSRLQARAARTPRLQQQAPTTLWAIRWNYPDGPKYSCPFENERWARDCFASSPTIGSTISTTLVVSHNGGQWREVDDSTRDGSGR